MPDTAVDTRVLLDVLLDDPDHAARSAQALQQAATEGALVIGPATLAELATAFARNEDASGLEPFLKAAGIRVTPLRRSDVIAAGQAFAKDLRRPRKVPCPACGKAVTCDACKTPLRRRTRIATDFLIAAHARGAGRLLTRDQGLAMQGVTIIRP